MYANGQLHSLLLDEIQILFNGAADGGLTCGEIYQLVEGFCTLNNFTPGCLGYLGFPKPCCISIGEVAGHGCPDADVIIPPGELVKIDVTLVRPDTDGKPVWTDACRTYNYGLTDTWSQQLKEIAWGCTRDAMYYANDLIRAGAPLTTHALASAIQSWARRNGVAILEEYGGHCIGRAMHVQPIMLYTLAGVKQSPNHNIVEGTCFCIEPIVVEGTAQAFGKADGWPIIVPGRKSAQYEIQVCHMGGHLQLLVE